MTGAGAVPDVLATGQMLDRASTLTDDQPDAPLELPVPGTEPNPGDQVAAIPARRQIEQVENCHGQRTYAFGIQPYRAIGSIRKRLDRPAQTCPLRARLTGHDQLDESPPTLPATSRRRSLPR
jgi:hypothetical protein